jgi:hypothetical protein
MEIAEGLGRPLNDFSISCLAVVMCCAKYAEDENNKVGTVFNLLQKHLGTSVLFVYLVLLILFHNLFCNPICSVDHLNEAHRTPVIHRPHFGNL